MTCLLIAMSFDCYLNPDVYRVLFKFTSSNDNYLNASLNGSFKVRNLTSISLSLKDIIYCEMENITSILNINGVDLTYVINGSNGYEGVFNSSDSLILSDLEVGTYDVHVRFNLYFRQFCCRSKTFWNIIFICKDLCLSKF